MSCTTVPESQSSLESPECGRSAAEATSQTLKKSSAWIQNNEKVLVFKKKYGLDGKFVIMYSGNIGLYYDLENLIKIVEKIKVGTKTTDGREVVFAFVGAGSVLDKLVLYVKEHHMFQ